MNAVEILSAIVCGFALAWTVLVTVLVSKALQSMVLYAERAHIRAQKNVDQAFDRLMARDYSDFKTYQLAESTEGGYTPPEETKYIEVPKTPLRRDGPPWSREEPELPEFEDFDKDDTELIHGEE
jgi:hypothetical protein